MYVICICVLPLTVCADKSTPSVWLSGLTYWSCTTATWCRHSSATRSYAPTCCRVWLRFQQPGMFPSSHRTHQLEQQSVAFHKEGLAAQHSTNKMKSVITRFGTYNHLDFARVSL